MQNPNIHLRNDYIVKEKPAAKQVAIRLMYVSCKQARNDRELKRNPCTQAIEFFFLNDINNNRERHIRVHTIIEMNFMVSNTTVSN